MKLCPPFLRLRHLGHLRQSLRLRSRQLEFAARKHCSRLFRSLPRLVGGGRGGKERVRDAMGWGGREGEGEGSGADRRGETGGSEQEDIKIQLRVN